MREEEKKQVEEAEKLVEEARRLEDVGRSLSLLPTQPNSCPDGYRGLGHLCWVRRSQPGGCSDQTVGGKAPQKEFLQAGKVKKTRKYWPGTVALWEIWWFQKSTELLIWKTSLLAVSL